MNNINIMINNEQTNQLAGGGGGVYRAMEQVWKGEVE